VPGLRRAAQRWSTAVAALVAAVALAGCADGARPGAAAAASAEVDLRIRIAASARDGAPSRAWRLRCDPAGGDWPAVDAACERLTARVLRPIGFETRDLQAITSQPVRVSGRAFGATVSLRFPATGSSTRSRRLRSLRAALGSRAFREAARRSR